jgi:hypothetical protein
LHIHYFTGSHHTDFSLPLNLPPPGRLKSLLRMLWSRMDNGNSKKKISQMIKQEIHRERDDKTKRDRSFVQY